jgi:hypothetical protein
MKATGVPDSVILAMGGGMSTSERGTCSCEAALLCLALLAVIIVLVRAS